MMPGGPPPQPPPPPPPGMPGGPPLPPPPNTVLMAQMAAEQARLSRQQAERRRNQGPATRVKPRHRGLRRFVVTVVILIVLVVAALFVLNWLKVGQNVTGNSGLGAYRTSQAGAATTAAIASRGFAYTVRLN